MIEANALSEVLENILDKIEDKLIDLCEADLINDAKVREMVRIIVRRYFRDIYNKRPLTTIHLIRVPDIA